jgi:hypothetical protein
MSIFLRSLFWSPCLITVIHSEDLDCFIAVRRVELFQVSLLAIRNMGDLFFN